MFPAWQAVICGIKRRDLRQIKGLGNRDAGHAGLENAEKVAQPCDNTGLAVVRLSAVRRAFRATARV